MWASGAPRPIPASPAAARMRRCAARPNPDVTTAGNGAGWGFWFLNQWIPL